MLNYLIIRHIRAKNVNMVSNNYVFSAAQPLGLSLMVHALGLRCGTTFKSFALIHHDARAQGQFSEPIAGARRHSSDFRFAQRRGASYVNTNDYAHGLTLSHNPVALMNIELSLVLSYDAAKPPKGLANALYDFRLLGGEIVSYRFDPKKDVSDQLAVLLHGVRSGFWVIERSDLVDPQAPAKSMAAALMDPGHSWLSPTPLGYALITPEKPRTGVRAQTQGVGRGLHAFCEPLLGLVQYVSVRRFEGPAPFWHTQWLQDDVFIVTQTR